MEKISIIVPVYNAEKYLSECIESLIKQTYKCLEIILVNDGSTDNSLKICEGYAKQDDRIKVRSIENSGVSIARNLGIDISTGEYITFVDSDDWAEPNMLEFAINKLKESASDIVIWSYFKNYYNKELELSLIPGGDQVFESNKDILYLKSIYAMYGEETIKESVSTGTVWCKLYKRDFIKKNKLEFNPLLTRSQDTIFSINAFKRAKKISYFDKSLYHYRINDSSTCSGTRFIPNTEIPFNSLLREFEDFIKTLEKNDNYLKALDARIIQVLRWHLEHNYFHPSYKKGLWSRRKEIIQLINSSPYKEALKNADMKILPKKEKVMTKLFTYNFILGFYLIYIINDKINNNRHRKFE